MWPFTRTIKVLLVNPQTPPSYWGFNESAWFVGARAAHAPLSLITLAGLLPVEWELKLVDMNVQKLRDKHLAWADVVFVTGMIVQKDAMSALLKRCRALGKPTVAGGPFVSSAPEAEELRDATTLVIGEAEDRAVIEPLIADLRAGALQSRYVASGLPAMTVSPVPRYDLLRRHAYCAMSMQASRGCPHQCEFCNVRMLYGRRPRFKAPEQIAAELQAIYETGYRGNIFFVDDNFIGNAQSAKAILYAVRDWQAAHGRPFLFYTEADIRLSEKDEVVELMVEAGFFAVFTGFESSSEEALKEVGKTQNLRVDAVAAVSRLRQKGLLVYGGFIVGFDADGPECFVRTSDFIESCGIDFAMAGLLIALPGTPLETRLKAEGRILSDSTGDAIGMTNIMPKRMSRLDMLRGYRALLQRLYDPKKFFERAYGGLVEWRQGVKRRLTMREFLAVPRSIFRQGIIARYRLQYWRFILRTMFTHPKKMARAFTMAISGHHFFRYTRRVVLPQLHAAEHRLLKEAADQPAII